MAGALAATLDQESTLGIHADIGSRERACTPGGCGAPKPALDSLLLNFLCGKEEGALDAVPHLGEAVGISRSHPGEGFPGLSSW